MPSHYQSSKLEFLQSRYMILIDEKTETPTFVAQIDVFHKNNSNVGKCLFLNIPKSLLQVQNSLILFSVHGHLV